VKVLELQGFMRAVSVCWSRVVYLVHTKAVYRVHKHSSCCHCQYLVLFSFKCFIVRAVNDFKLQLKTKQYKSTTIVFSSIS